jgi:uncharacterized Zn-binding protein involved in type VI secretion
MPQIIRDGDPTTTGHGCDPVTTVTGPTGAIPNTVNANGIPIEVKGNPTVVHLIPGGGGCVPHVAEINVGSPNVFIHGIPVARQGDSTDGGALISGSPNVFVNSKGKALESTGWAETVLDNGSLESIFNADNEERVIYSNPDVDANETGEYGDGYFGATNPRGDDKFEGNASPVTGEEGAVQVDENSESTFPPAGSEAVIFLPHTDPRISTELNTKLENIAATLDTTLKITSAYRSPAYNSKVGGKKASKHMLGIAVDVLQTGWNTSARIRFIEECINEGIEGIGLYNSFTHIDLGGKRAWGPTGSRRSLYKQSWAVPTLQDAGYATS